MELKQPMSYEEQLHRLITHGIVVDDRDRAIDILKRVSILTSISAAQFILESGYGKSEL